MKRINEYINEYKDFVYIFYTRIIDVNLPDGKESRRAINNVSQTTSARASLSQQALKYSVNSSLIRLQDLERIVTILRQQQAVIRAKELMQIAQKINWSRFTDREETYFLFTQLKKDRIVRIPPPEHNEEKAIRENETLVKCFPSLPQDSFLRKQEEEKCM